jgi:hypothetical protein
MTDPVPATSTTILTVAELPPDYGWLVFLDRVEETLAATS